MDLRQLSRQFISEFLEVYKSLPCLWDLKDKDYQNRFLKDEAYNIMVSKLKEADVNADRELVVKKLDSMRGSFRRELKKIEVSLRAGDTGPNVYKPKLWYFDQLTFLLGNIGWKDDPKKSKEFLEETDTNGSSDSGSPSPSDSNPVSGVQQDVLDFFSNEIKEEVLSGDECQEKELKEEKLVKESSLAQPAEVYLPVYQEQETSNSKSKKRKFSASPASDRLSGKGSKQVVGHFNDEFAIMGENYANKMRKLPEDKVAIVDKLITDLLFEAHCGNVNNSTRLVFTQVNSTDPNTN